MELNALKLTENHEFHTNVFLQNTTNLTKCVLAMKS